MNLKEIKELIEVLKDTDVTELELEKAGTRIKIKKGAQGRVPVLVEHVTPAMSHEPSSLPAPVPQLPSASRCFQGKWAEKFRGRDVSDCRHLLPFPFT